MKLHTKLIGAFIAVVLLMGVSQSVFLQAKIRTTFQNYLDQQTNAFLQRMELALEGYYQETGDWKGVQQFFVSNTSEIGQGHGMMMRGMMNMSMSNNIYLLDTSGTIIADSDGLSLGKNGNELSGKRVELVVNGAKKGTLVFHQGKLQVLEEQFLQASRTAILISGLLATVLAALFSFFIANRIVNPLNVLMAGIKQLASGKKVKEIPVATYDEFYELGEAFNDMARELERNEEVRRSLVADVAHELRTPLAILQGKLESIQEGVISPDEETILELTDEVYRLSRLVKDLQQLSLAEAGKLSLNLKQVDIGLLIERVCRQLQWLAEEKEIKLQYDHVPTKCILPIDTDRMTQVIVNLVGNALRYTPEKCLVEVSAQQHGHFLIIQVADTGQGIPEEVLPSIFDRFYKGDPSRSRNESGTGLGLSIAKGFVEAHGGTIAVESQRSKGTIFTVTLPMEKLQSG